MFSFLISIAKDLLASSIRFAKAAAMICMAAVCIFFATPILLTLLGYKVNASVTETAKIGAEKHKVAECDRIISYGLFGPPSGEVRRMCIRKYAEITQDPTACELLMPSNYGWDCLGTVASLLNTGFGCSSYASGEIYCSSGVRGRNIGVDDCKKYKEADLKYWCYGERTRTLAGVYDCDKIPADPLILREECQRWHAYKLKDASQCSPIRDDKLRKVCELKVKYRGSDIATP